MTAFTKMHGLGNDFAIINTIDQTVDWRSLPIQTLADRRLGIGFDQLLLIERSKLADFFCRIINADGSEAEQCGNGLRCIARYLHENGIHTSRDLTLATNAGVFAVTIPDYQHICITLDAPVIDHNRLPLENLPDFQFATLVSTGNPHAIVCVQELETIAVEKDGSLIAAHPRFTQGVNVGFMQIIDQQHARLRTLERGAGETAACGSNACAAAAAGIANGWLKQGAVTIEYRFGNLLIEWAGEGEPIRLIGPAERVYEGVIWSGERR